MSPVKLLRLVWSPPSLRKAGIIVGIAYGLVGFLILVYFALPRDPSEEPEVLVLEPTPAPSATSGAIARTLSATVITPTPVNTPKTSDCDRPQGNIYCLYTVQAGDTLTAIATAFGLTDSGGVKAWQLLLYSNRDQLTSEDDILQIGQMLRVPFFNGVIHTVATGETLSDIATQYGVAVGDINGQSGISDSRDVKTGQEILVPSPKRFEAPGPPTATYSDPFAY